MTKRLPQARRGDAKDKDAYFAALDECDGRVTDACTLAGVSHGQVKQWRSDEEFKFREELAKLRRQDKTRKVVHEMIDEKETAIVVRAMAALPEYRKEVNVNVRGEVSHYHAIENMDDAGLRDVIELGAKAIEMHKDDDGSFSPE